MNYTIRKGGFTLIELMIVIAIIGILAVTLVPSLTGAQARARDVGRIQNVASTRAVLETYYSDNGEFPAEQTAGCFSKNDGSVDDNNLKNILSKGKAPVDPQSANVSKPCNTGGVLGYKLLTKAGTPKSSYLIVTNVEIDKKANTNLTAATDNDYKDYSSIVGAYTGDTAIANAADSVYAELY